MGRPPKRKPNMTGLRNQRRRSSDGATQPTVTISDSSDEWEDEDEDFDPRLKTMAYLDIDSDCDADLEDDDDEWKELEEDRFHNVWIAFNVEREEDACDAHDTDWPLSYQQKRTKEKKARPKQYAKGPDVANRAASTKYKRRVQNELKGHTFLDNYGFTKTPRPLQPRETSPAVIAEAHGGLDEITPPVASQRARGHSDASLSDSSPQSKRQCLNDALNGPDRDMQADAHDETGEEDGTGEWEDTIDYMVNGGDAEASNSSSESPARQRGHVRGWKELREQIKRDMNRKGTPPTRYRQYTLLKNFATLLLKGYRRIAASLMIAEQFHEGKGTYLARRIRILARHYEVFEQLPEEKRGGSICTRSLLNNEIVEVSCRSWLSTQKVGSVTPKAFCHAINNTLLPSLDISPTSPICERTARRWLFRLGYRRTLIRKGVYMDGHERPDVVKYRTDIFLPAMAEFEACMAKYDGKDLVRSEPELPAGVKIVIAYFHDECCFHALDFKRSAWLRAGETVLQKKGRGRLIHVSDFICEETGRLVRRDVDGKIVEDARRIIYPGANGDAWWDTKQLIEQVKAAIKLHKSLHPHATALFIFDQSSAHASLPPDALRAFDMNKSDGSKRREIRIQKDTVIPMTNPTVEMQGKIQKMTDDQGQPKGLESVLIERGFDLKLPSGKSMRAKCAPVCPMENINCCMARLLSQQDDFKNQLSMLETVITEAGHKCLFLPKFHCELNPIEMYWGWAKYRYREVPKTTFEASKQAAIQYLNACPIEVIQRFINRSWRFMSAYRQGLTGRAAEWAVKKQKQHRSVSQAAMMAIESILN